MPRPLAFDLFVYTIRFGRETAKAIGYEGDDAKAASNVDKHGVAFEAAQGFDWETSKTVFDDERSALAGEDRYLTFGFIGVRLHALYWAPRGERIRIIGLRKANQRERRAYEEAE